MTHIFISHAVADKALADKFTTFLKEAIGVPSDSIFCSSVDGHGNPLGVDFNEYMQKKIRRPELVILLMSPRYMESWFCLMELGATWAKSLNALPVIVPPTNFDVVSSTLGLRQGWKIDDNNKLIELRQMIQQTNISLEKRNEHDWEKKRTAWKVDLKRLLKNLAPATNVPASEYTALQDELVGLKQELEKLQECYSEAGETIDELKAAKDPVAVKAIMATKTDFDADHHFEELIEVIASLQPKVSACFYRNLIMDLYGKAIPIDWYDPDQKADAESAIQYNILDKDTTNEYLWDSSKLRKVRAAVDNLDNFLQSQEAEELLKKHENADITMETDNLEFWEEFL